MLWKLVAVAPFPPFFLAYFLNASRTNTYVAILIYHTSHVYSRTIHRRRKTELWTLIRVGSAMPHDQVELKDNTTLTDVVMVTLPNQISPHHHISVGRSEILRDLPVLGRHSAAESSDNHWEFIRVCHSDRFSSGVCSANHAIQYVVIVRLPHLLEVK